MAKVRTIGVEGNLNGFEGLFPVPQPGSNAEFSRHFQEGMTNHHILLHCCTFETAMGKYIDFC
jgi:hypothetical protein